MTIGNKSFYKNYKN